MPELFSSLGVHGCHPSMDFRAEFCYSGDRAQFMGCDLCLAVLQSTEAPTQQSPAFVFA